MRKFYFLWLFLLLPLAGFSGCAGQGNSSNLMARLVVEQGTMRYIQAKPESEWKTTALNVIAVAEDARAFASGETVTLQDLLDYIKVSEKLQDLTPADRAIAIAVAQEIAGVYEQTVPETPEGEPVYVDQTTIGKIMGWVIGAAQLYSTLPD